MRAVGHYKLTLELNGKKYTTKQKIKVDIGYNNRIDIALCMDGNPFTKEFYVFGKFYYLSFPHYKTDINYIHLSSPRDDYLINNTLFRIIHYIDHNLNTSIFHNIGSNNYRSIRRIYVRYNKILDWVKAINDKSSSIYRMNDNNDLETAGSLKINVDLNLPKIIGMMI